MAVFENNIAVPKGINQQTSLSTTTIITTAMAITQ